LKKKSAMTTGGTKRSITARSPDGSSFYRTHIGIAAAASHGQPLPPTKSIHRENRLPSLEPKPFRPHPQHILLSVYSFIGIFMAWT
jgi:hypothetical protein